MSPRRKRFIAPGISLFLLGILAASAVTNTAAAAPAGGNRVVVDLTLDPQTNKVTASPDPVILLSAKKHFAHWRVAKGSKPFDFKIGIEDQTNPTKRKPAKKLTVRPCSGTGSARNCDSDIATADLKGDHKYSVTVNTAKGPVTTDPEVTIDP